MKGTISGVQACIHTFPFLLSVPITSNWISENNMSRAVKTEHGGAKNGGGMWTTRSDAKQISKKLRRAKDKKLSRMHD